MSFVKAIAALVLATAVVPAAALAQDARPSLGAGRDDQDQARAAVRAGRQMPLARVIQMIQSRTPGQLLNATTAEEGGKPVYRVQWRQQNGRVVVFIVDAETGAMLGQQGG